jgi:phosphoglycolate phosphatase
MSLLKPSIVLFDMDGTTVRHVNPRVLGVLEFLDDQIFRASQIFRGKKIDPYLAHELKHQPKLIVHRALHKFRRKPVEQIVQPCPGIKTLLNTLKKFGVPMGIVSNGLGTGYGHDILETFQLSEYFGVQIFREDIQHSKPHPDPLLRALKKIKDPLSEQDVIWYIGDRHKDVVAALAANNILPAKIIPLAYGVKASIAVLEKGQNPEQIIVNYTDFAQKIEPLLNTASPRN